MRHALNATVALGALTLSPQVSTAQDARQDTIIVTAPGPERSADELIGNATGLDRDDILEVLAGSLGDTLADQPGTSTSFFGQGASRPVLRGLGAERVQVLTNGLGVIDASAASPDHQVAADGIDAEKIEILRGPAALAYGGQAIGGVVNVIDGLIIEAKPTETTSADLFVASNSVNEGTELAAKGQVSSGPFVLTLSGSRRDFGNFEIPGFVESAPLRALEEAEEEDHENNELEGEEHHEEEARGEAENSFLDTQTLSAGLSWIGEDAYWGIAIRQQTAEYGLPGHSEHEHEHEEEGEAEEDGEENPFIDLEQTRIDLRAGLSIDQGPLTKVSGALSIVDYDHTEFEAPGEAGTVYGADGIEGRLELDHAIGGFAGAVGLQYLDKDLTASGEEAFITPTDTQSLGLFLYEAKDWESGLGIEGGLRFEAVELTNSEAGSTDFNLFSGSIGLHRHTTVGLFIGGQISLAERAPNESELFAFGEHLATSQFEIGDPGLSKERGLNLEGTARWRGERGGLGINLFMSDFQNFIFLTPANSPPDGVDADLPVFLFTQEDARFIGGEAYADYLVTDGPLGADWMLEASLDVVDAELDDGGSVPFLPPMTLKGSATADWGPLDITVALIHAAAQNDPGAGQLETDGYTAIDLKAGLDLADMGLAPAGTEAFLEVRNATDEDIRYATSVLKDVLPAPGRNLRLGLRLAF
jgi:iron complex outermembrane receptor protein